MSPRAPGSGSRIARVTARPRPRAAVSRDCLGGLLCGSRLLYDGAIVAERYAAVGEFLDTNPSGADPTVAAIITAARSTTGAAFAADLHALAYARGAAAELLGRFDALLLPTTTEHPSLAAVAADPAGINRRMGTFTNFCNLLDLAAIAIPAAPLPDARPFGVMLIAAAFGDQVAIDIAARLSGVSTPLLVNDGVELGARYCGPITTSDAYRLTVLDTTPAKPALVRTDPGAGAGIRGELYRISEAGLGRFLAALPPPMALTAIELENGSEVVGFTATQDATSDATDITAYRGWLAYLAAQC